MKQLPGRVWRPTSVLCVAALIVSGATVPAAATSSPPTVTSLSATSGPVGGHVKLTVHGSGFTGATAVMFGGAKGGSLHVVSSQTLTVVVPAHKAARLDVRVITGHGDSAKSRHDVYTYVAPPAVTSVSVAGGSSAGALNVTVKGSGFTHVKKVLFGKATGTHLHVVSSKRLTITAPAHTAGRVDVRVVSAYGTSKAKPVDRFTYTAPGTPPPPPAGAPSPVITTTALPAAERGQLYGASVTAGSGTPPYAFSATGLPAGLSLSAAGTLSGTTFVAPGQQPVVVKVVDARGNSASATLPLTVKAHPGQVYGWGDNSEGEVGTGAVPGTPVATPTALAGLTDVVEVTGGSAFGFALRADGTVYSWGQNNYGQLGDGTGIDHYAPQQVPGLTGIVSVTAGYYGAYALKADGTVLAWGLNGYGELGDGTTTNAHAPVAVPGLTHVIDLGAGYESAFAVTADGRAWSWGLNDHDQLGTGSTAPYVSTPTVVPGLTDVRQVESRMYTVHALLGNGTVVGWGSNVTGAIGDATVTDRATPVPLVGLTGVVEISDGQQGGYALLADGTVRAWGDNAYGEIGDGSTTTRLSPVAVPGLSGVVAISAGAPFCFVTLADGSVRAWGGDALDELGDGAAMDEHSPTLQSDLANATDIGAAYSTGFAIR